MINISSALRQILPENNLALKNPSKNKPVKAKTIERIELIGGVEKNIGKIGINPPIR